MSTSTSSRGKIVGDGPCPACRARGRDKTGNHLIEFEDGGKHCPKCKYTVKANGEEAGEDEDNIELTMENIPNLPMLAVRGISESMMKQLGHHVALDPATREPTHVFYPRHRNGALVGYKVRVLDGKKFYSIGDGREVDLVGQHLEGNNRKLCIITEGEDDLAAAKMMLAKQGKDYCVVSLPNGSNATLTKHSHEWLTKFDSIILAVDMDPAGDAAADKLTALFDGGVVKRAQLPHKDALDCLVAISALSVTM